MALNVLLLRGLAREIRHWGDFPDKLQKALGDVVIHTLDLPGIGTERGRRPTTSIPSMMEDVRERWLNLPSPPDATWILVGHSLGGMISLAWAKNHPQDFVGIAILNSSSAGLSWPWRRLRPWALLTLFKISLARSETRKQTLALRMLSSHPGANAEAVAFWVSIAQDAPVSPAVIFRQLLAAAFFKANLPVQPKILVLMSEGDAMVHPSCSRALARAQNVEPHVHPKAGHELTLDACDWVIDALDRFVSRLC